MLSISFGEILLIAAVGLVVIGPERLPKAARFAGHLFGRVQRQIQSVKADIKKEMDAADLQNIREEYHNAAKQTTESAGDIFRTIRQTAVDAADDVNKTAAINNNDNDENKTVTDNSKDNPNPAATFPPPHTAPVATGANNKKD